MKKYVFRIIIFLSSISLLSAGQINTAPGFERFIEDLAQYGFAKKQISLIFKKAVYQPNVLSLISRPAEDKPWYLYKKIFVNKQLIQGGVNYWKKNRQVLRTAADLYGGPPEIIVAIIGIESKYGKVRTSYRVLDALSTLAFYCPARQDYFRGELQEYLLLTREEKIDPLKVRGSYAGAMGKPQFMPSSYRRYAVDQDQNGKRDLFGSDADAIASVANYLKENGWEKGAKIAVPFQPKRKSFAKLIKKNKFEPSFYVYQLVYYGLNPLEEKLPLRAKARIIVLKNENSEAYWIGLWNFYVITLYNRSTVYGMAVYQLAQEIKKNYQAQGVNND